MNAGTAKINIQQTLGIPEAKRSPHIGPLTRRAFEALALSNNEAPWPTRIDAALEVIDPPTTSLRNINRRGLELVKHFEGLKRLAYRDEVGVWTIGIGHTGLVHNDGTVFEGRTITEGEALALLDYDMNQSEAAVLAITYASTLNDDQFSALVSWHFNTGGPKAATLWKYIRSGDYKKAADQFVLWDKATVRNKVVRLRGLTRRRRSERNLFLGLEDYLVEVLD